MMLTWVEIKDGMLMALSAIRGSKLRAFLTILGVMVGVSSVIGIASIIDGLNGAVDQRIESLGTNVIWIFKFPPGVDHDELSKEMRNRPPITVGEAEAVQKSASLVDGVSPQNYYFQRGGNIVKFKNRKFNQPMLMGCWPDYVRVNNKDVSQGRFISEVDQQFRTQVCVIGHDIADVLFESENPIDQEIRVNGKSFRVIGVLEDVKSSLGGRTENNVVFIPLSTFQKMYPDEKELFLAVRAVSYDDIPLAMDEITGILRNYRKVPFGDPDNFALSTQDQFKEAFGNIAKYLYIASIVITSVGLMVGGIGVMNIMLVSVTERTREIGIRKAIGAKRSNIILQFLTEAMTLSGAGGLFGVLFGVVIGLIVNGVLDFPLTISIVWVLVGFVVSVSVGLISGVYPAIKAAWLDPIEALRYE